MKVGILTFQFADNYGALLQAYALKEYIKSKGHSVEIINYVSDHFHAAYSINPFDKDGFMRKVKAIIKWPFVVVQHRKFNYFRNRYLEISEQEMRELSVSTFDVVIVGSDQVWNLAITQNDMSYFLGIDYCKNIVRKASYAASARDDFPNGEHSLEIRNLLLDFDAISVREYQMKENLQRVLGLNCTVVCDPVFLRKKEIWEEMTCKPSFLPKKYILAYMLRSNDELCGCASKISKELNIPVIVVHPQERRICGCGTLRYDIGVCEFLSLIKDAEYIVTNSFHAFAFALIFSKKIFFECIDGTSNRILNLLEAMKIECNGVGKVVRYAELSCYGNKEYMDYIKKSKAFIDCEIFATGSDRHE